MVNATSGTTVFGAYDPLDEIADICKKYGGVWLHVDGAWGGAVLLSKKLRYDICQVVVCDVVVCMKCHVSCNVM